MLYIIFFMIALIVTNGYKLYLHHKKIQEQNEQNLKVRPQNIQKPTKQVKKTWNSVLGCYEIED